MLTRLIRREVPASFIADVPSVALAAAVWTGIATWAVPARSAGERETLTVDRAVESSLELEGFEEAQSARLEALSGERRSATTLPNPTLAVGREQHWESGEAIAEDVFVLEQALPIWGTRRLRGEAIESERRAARSSNAEERLDRRMRTRRAFYEALRERRRLAAARAFAEHVESSIELLEARRRADDASEYEVDRLRTSLADAESTVDDARASLIGARGRLGGLIDRSATPVEAWSVAGGLLDVEMPELTALLDRLEDRPAIAKLRASARAQEERRRALGRSLVPTPTLRGGYKRFDAPTGGSLHGFVAGLSTELPLFDREIGRRRRAEAERTRLRARATLRRRRAEEELRSGYRAAEERLRTARAYRDEAVRRAEDLLGRARERREAGAGSLFELVDAHRTHFETEIDAIDRAWRARSAVIDVRRYAGGFP